ncbi:MAG TPA: hypothetical protein VMS54_11935 [Vicinamibacterales bacterium]|nr:hypothetical protein [Vicinamibacterales bacterium]
MTGFLPQGLLAVALLAAPLTFTLPASSATQQATNRDAQTLADFQTRVKSYLAMRQKLLTGRPTLPDKATPDQIEAYQRALGDLIIAARKGARKGDVFGADMTVMARRLLGPIFKGPDGAAIRNAILEEAQPLVPTVNTRYPDDVPVSSMPPEILKALPKLDETLEFRFVGRHLILMDVPAHLIVDIVDNAMPS